MTRPTWIKPEGSFQIDIDDLGTLDFRVGSGEVVFLAQRGDDRRFPDHPLARSPQKIEFLLLRECAVIAARLGREIYRFDSAKLTLDLVESLSRTDEDDYAFMFVRFVKSGDSVLVVYENGLVCLYESIG